MTMERFTSGRFVVKSIRRRTFRNAVTILTFAVITSSLLLSAFLVGGAQTSVQSGMDRLGADLMVVPIQYRDQTDAILLTGHPSTFFMNTTVMDKVEGVAGVEKVAPQTFIASLAAACCTIPTQLIAFNATKDFTIHPWLQQELGRPLEPGEIILGHQVIAGGVGDHMTFYGRIFLVAGILEQTGTGVDTSVFIVDSDAVEMAKESEVHAVQPLNYTMGQISTVLVKLIPGSDPETVAAQIQSSVPGVSVITSHYLATQVANQLSGTIGSLQFTALAVTVVSVPLVATVSSMVANERKREIGLLRTMGATRRFVFSSILAEALVLAAIGALVGLAASAFIVMVFQNFIVTSLGIPFLWPSFGVLAGQVGIIALAAIGIGGLAATYPALKASRTDPYDAIRSGQA